MKLVTIIGARPQIIKAAALSRAIRNHYADQIQEIIVHTGQHYDDNMSQVFFDELQIPRPDYNLHVGSASHGVQTARMTEGIEALLIKEQARLHRALRRHQLDPCRSRGRRQNPRAHRPHRGGAALVQQGHARGNQPHRVRPLLHPALHAHQGRTGEPETRRLPDGERVDPSTRPDRYTTIDKPKVYHCGDIMYDNSLHFADIAEEKTDIIQRMELVGKPFILATIHRDSNTDHPERLSAIFKAIIRLSEECQIVLPLHPRTSKLLKTNLDETLQKHIFSCQNIKLIPPVSFLEMIALERHARLVMTDSGGVQKEAYFFKKPCIILRPETEWVEIVQTGNAILADADESRIMQAWQHFKDNPPTSFPEIFGDGHAAEFMLEKIILCKSL